MRKYLREAEEGHTIELLYTPFFKLNCPDFPNENYIESANYDFWSSVDKICKRLVDLANDLTVFLPEELKGKVTSVKLAMEDDSNLLQVLCKVKGPVEQIKDELIEWVNGQMSDGWGENFEQEELGSTEMFACYDENDDTPRPYVEFYDSERDARNFCREQNDYEVDEEEGEEEIPYYRYDSVKVYATCSFWKKGSKIPYKVYVDGYDEAEYDVGGYDKEAQKEKAAFITESVLKNSVDDYFETEHVEVNFQDTGYLDDGILYLDDISGDRGDLTIKWVDEDGQDIKPSVRIRFSVNEPGVIYVEKANKYTRI